MLNKESYKRLIGVMIMKFTNLTEFSDFTDQMPYSHFTQMEGNYELKVAEGTDSHLVELKIMTIK